MPWPGWIRSADRKRFDAGRSRGARVDARDWQALAWYSDRGDCHSAPRNGVGLPPLAGCPMRMPMAIETAVILAGAVAKGAFEAGALGGLAPHAETLRITRFVGASAGSL